MALGQAYIDVHGNTAPFLADIERLKAQIAAQSATLRVNAGGTGGPITNDNNLRGAADRAAAAARTAAAGQDDLAAANTRVARSADDANDGMSRYTRKLLALGIAATFAAIGAAAIAMEGAIAVAGIKSAETLRSLRLELESTGLSAKNVAIQTKALEDLANQGLSLSGLSADNLALSNLGATAKEARDTLSQLADIGASQGLVGQNLQKFIDSATSSAKNLKKAFDDQTIGSRGALASAVQTSPTQAFDALKSQLGQALGEAFDNPKIAQAINGIGGKLKDSITKIAPEIENDVVAVVGAIGQIIGPLTTFLSGAAADIGQFLSAAFDPSTELHKTLSDLVGDVEDIVQVLAPFAQGFATAISIAIQELRPLLDLLDELSQTPAGKVELEIAGGLAAIALAARALGGPVAIVLSLAAAIAYAYQHFQIAHEIINGFFAGVVTVAGNAVEFLVNAVADFAKVSLGNFEIILKGLAYLPDWLGGGAANSAAQAVQGLIDGISAVQTSIDDTIDSGISAVNTMAALGNIDFGNTINGLNATATAAQRAATLAGQAAQAAYSAANGGLFGPVDPKVPGTIGPVAATPKVGNPFTTPTFAPIKGAASAAQSAASKLADSLKAFHQSLSDFIQGIGGAQTVDAVDSAFKTLQSAIDTEDKALGKAEPSGLKTYLAKQKAILDKSASELQLALAERADFLSKADVSVPNARQAGAGGIIKGLQDQLTLSTEFAADLKKLQGLGLNQTAIQQFLAAGPTEPSLRAMNDIIQAGKPAVSSINTLQTAIGKQGESLGTTLASNFKDAGTQAAQGLIDGLASAEPALEAQMKKLANVMTSTIKKDLKIKSPSQVFAEVGQNITAGLIQGIGDKAPVVPLPTIGKLGAQGVATDQSINFHANAINVSGATKDNATEIGNGIGAAIADVLLARRIGAALGSS